MSLLSVATLPQTGRLRLLCCALFATCALGLVAAQHAAASSWAYTESASGLQYPYTLSTTDSSYPEDTACAPTNQCVIVGYIYDSSDNEQAYVDPIVDGIPRAGFQVTLPADAATDPYASLDYVACQADNSCTAVGYYENQSSVTVPMVVHITSGTPSTAVAITPPANSTPGDEGFSSLACPATGTCVAVGSDQSSSTSYDEPWVVQPVPALRLPVSSLRRLRTTTPRIPRATSRASPVRPRPPARRWAITRRRAVTMRSRWRWRSTPARPVPRPRCRFRRTRCRAPVLAPR